VNHADRFLRATRPALVLVLGCLLASQAAAGDPIHRRPLPATPNRFVVVSHRGSHLKQAPENSLQSIEAAIADGADYVEMDVRKSKDGVHFLMHDSTPRRMAVDGPNQPLSELTWAEIRALQLRAPTGSPLPPTPIPTFESALKACKGRIRIYLDFKNGDRAEVTRMIRAEGMEHSVVVYDAVEAAAEWHRLAPNLPLIVSPPRSALESQASWKSWLERTPIEIVDRIDPSFSPERVEAAHAAGVAVWPDTLGKEDTEDRWKTVARAGADGLQTDHPEAVNAWRGRRPDVR
jgi:glycerophosphoryl diester phosphodiesterase